MPRLVSWSSRCLGIRSATRPANGREEQERQELQPGRDAEGGAAVGGELEHQPVLGDALHPGAGVGDDAAGGVQAVVGVGQGAESGTRGVSFGSVGLREAVEEGGGATQDVALVGGQVGELDGQPGVAAPAVGQDDRAAAVGERRRRPGGRRSRADGVRRRPSPSQARHGAGHATAAARARARASSPTVMVTLPEQQPEHGHLAEAQVVVGVPLAGQAAAQPHHAQRGARRRAPRRCGQRLLTVGMSLA